MPIVHFSQFPTGWTRLTETRREVYMTSYVLLKSVILILVIHINIILPSTSRSYKWFFPSGFPTETLYTFIFSPTRATHPAISPPFTSQDTAVNKTPVPALGTLPKQRQPYFKRAMTQGFTTVQTNRRTDILYGSTYSPDGGNRPETSVPIHQSTRRRMPEDNHRIKFIEFQDFWDVTMRCWAILDVSKCAGSRSTVFMQAIRSFKTSGSSHNAASRPDHSATTTVQLAGSSDICGKSSGRHSIYSFGRK